MSDTNHATPGNTAFLLFLVFLVLKLCGVTAWSWWWVTSPLWISAGIGLGVTAVCLMVMGVLNVIGKR